MLTVSEAVQKRRSFPGAPVSEEMILEMLAAARPSVSSVIVATFHRYAAISAYLAISAYPGKHGQQSVWNRVYTTISCRHAAECLCR